MKSKAVLTFSIALATCGLVYPRFTCAQNSTAPSSVDPSVPASVARQDASRMVPAQAVLDKGIDAKKMQTGEQFQATLRESVHLKNGIELPRHTVLVGTIATDRMRDGGTSALALRFTKAQLKDGKVVPIQADIMGIVEPSEVADSAYGESGTSLQPWDGETLKIDEPSFVSGVDFHGSIGSRNSGVFVSTRKDEMKLSPGSQLSLAIAVRSTNRINGGA